jgi:hypothetical protein
VVPGLRGKITDRLRVHRPGALHGYVVLPTESILMPNRLDLRVCILSGAISDMARNKPVTWLESCY